MPGIAVFLSQSIDSALGKFVTQTSTALSAGIAPLVVIGLTIWATTYGMAVMRNEVSDPVMGFLKHLTKISLILSIALGSGIYQSQIVDGVSALQSFFVSIIAPTAAGESIIGGSSAGDIWHLIDDFEFKSNKLGLIIMGHGLTLMPVSGYLDVIAGLFVMFGSIVLVAVILGFTIMAKVAMAFMLGIGPMFIASLAFPPIAKFFEAWLGKVMNYTFLIMGLAASITISLVIVGAYVTHFDSNQSAANNIADAAGLVMLEIAIGVLIWQMPNIASGLGGGAAVGGGGIAGMIAGYMARGGGSKSESSNKKDKEGGTVKEDGGGASGGSGGGGSGGGSGGGERVPAYRRATLDMLQQSRSKN